MCTEAICTRIDPDWLHELKRGDPEAWKRLEQELTPALVRHAGKYLRNDEDARDVVQDVWRWSWKAITGGEQTELCRSFFFVSVRRAAGRLSLKRSKRPLVSLDRTSAGDPDGTPLKDTIVDHRSPPCPPETRELVKRAMNCLTERERAVDDHYFVAIAVRIGGDRQTLEREHVPARGLAQTRIHLLGLVEDDLSLALHHGRLGGDLRAAGGQPTSTVNKQLRGPHAHYASVTQDRQV